MNRYAELRHRQQEEFNALPLGFAFSQKQFDEMMQGWSLDPEKDLDKILRIPGGGYVQKKDADLLHKTRERHDAEMAAAIAEDTTGEGFIYQMFLYELDNHEYGYTRDTEDTLEENLDLIRQYKYSRYPVCHGSKDHIVGFVHTKDLVDTALDTPMSEWNVRELPAVPESIPIAKLLETMQERCTKICVVVDEHGGTAGIVTMSDIMEQIVGRIDDEYVHDTDDDVEELPDGTYQINGTLAINDLVELLGFEPEEADEVETAGGLLLKLFDRIPAEGDVAVLEHRGTKVTFTVLSMDRLRIDRICMAIDRPDEE